MKKTPKPLNLAFRHKIQVKTKSKIAAYTQSPAMESIRKM